MPKITIQGNVIDYPDSAASPNWSEALIDFAEKVQDALLSVVGSGDIGEQSDSITTYGTPTSITNLTFNSLTVRSAVIYYIVYRKTVDVGAVEKTQHGQLEINYKSSRVPNQWEIVNSYSGDDASVEFTIDDVTGDVQYTATQLTGDDDINAGAKQFISYRAITINNQ